MRRFPIYILCIIVFTLGVFFLLPYKQGKSTDDTKISISYQATQGTKYYDEELNGIYKILELGREGKIEEYEEAIEDYENLKSSGNSYSYSHIQYAKEQQKEFDDANNKSDITFEHKNGAYTQKEFIWTILDKHKKGTDTLLHIYINLHLYTTKIQGVEYVLVRKIDYKTLISKTNNALGYFLFKPSYHFAKNGELKTTINSRIAMARDGRLAYLGDAFAIIVTNNESKHDYGNTLEIVKFADVYKQVFKPSGKLLQKSKNIKIYHPLDNKKKNTPRRYKEFKGSRYYIGDLNEVYDLIKLSQKDDYTVYQKKLRAFKAGKGYKNTAVARSLWSSTTFESNFGNDTLYHLIPAQDSSQMQLKKLKFSTKIKKSKKFVRTIYEGKPELGDTLIYLCLKYHYINLKLMGLDYNLVYQVDYHAKVDISQGQNTGFYIQAIYDIDNSGNLTTDFSNRLVFITKYVGDSMNFEIHADSSNVRQHSLKGFRIPIDNEQYYYQYIFKSQKEVIEVEDE